MKKLYSLILIMSFTFVFGQNSPPVANNQTITTDQDTPAVVSLIATDADGDVLTYIIKSLPVNGTLKNGNTIVNTSDLPLSLSGNNITYTPNVDYSGTDSFTFLANSCSVTNPTNTTKLVVSGDFNETASKSYPMVISPQRISGSGSGLEVFKKNVDIKLTLGTGNIFESCQVKLDIIDFDDGLQFDINGVKLLDFQQKHWDSGQGANTTEFNGGGRFVTSGGMWQPWGGDGNPKLEITNGTIKLMVDTNIGTREDALPFMDTTVQDWTLATSFTYDCVAGFNLLIGNQNGGGGPSGINADLTAEAYVGPCTESNIATVTINVTGGGFSLQDDNNKIQVSSCTCNGKKDGTIDLSVEDNKYDYTVTVSGQSSPFVIKGVNKTASVTGLAKGTYTVCFKVDGQAGYEQCFEAVVDEPKGL